MRTRNLLAVLLCAAAVALLAGCVAVPPAPGATVQLIQAKGTGPMPTLLATKQIDGYIAWQPFVEVAPLAGIGRVLVYSQNLPPDDRWKNHPCCVLSARTTLMEANPDLVDSVTAVTILATQWINEHPNETAEINAEWLAGKGNFTYGNITVSSVEVLQRAISTVKYTNEPNDQWKSGNLEFVYALRELGVLTGSLANTSDAQTEALLFDTGPYTRANASIASGQFKTPAVDTRQYGIGYLMSDHDAALFVAVKNWQYFNDTYGIALKPQNPDQARPDLVDLIVNGQKVATFKLVAGDAGPQVMQLVGTDAVQFAYVGNPPVTSAIDKGSPAKIICALNTEGSGVVVTNDSPATDWTSFVSWAKDRSAAGKPVSIATPGKGSIQDVLMRYALEESGLSAKES